MFCRCILPHHPCTFSKEYSPKYANSDTPFANTNQPPQSVPISGVGALHSRALAPLQCSLFRLAMRCEQTGSMAPQLCMQQFVAVSCDWLCVCVVTSCRLLLNTSAERAAGVALGSVLRPTVTQSLMLEAPRFTSWELGSSRQLASTHTQNSRRTEKWQWLYSCLLLGVCKVAEVYPPHSKTWILDCVVHGCMGDPPLLCCVQS